MTTRPFYRTMPLTLPQVKVTRLYFGRRRFAAQTASFKDSSMFIFLSQSFKAYCQIARVTPSFSLVPATNRAAALISGAALPIAKE